MNNIRESYLVNQFIEKKTMVQIKSIVASIDLSIEMIYPYCLIFNLIFAILKSQKNNKSQKSQISQFFMSFIALTQI